MNPTAYLFRCSTCGKWSHAKKQPKKHQRWTRPDDDGFGDVPDGHFVDCGPFVPYIAMPGRHRR